ncbi:hypothetical protein M3J09_005702 [Ascochyta lentis]
MAPRRTCQSAVQCLQCSLLRRLGNSRDPRGRKQRSFQRRHVSWPTAAVATNTYTGKQMLYRS